MRKFLFFLIPILGLILAGALLSAVAGALGPGPTRSATTAFLGIILSILLFYLVEFIFKLTKTKHPVSFSFRNSLTELFLGLAVSLLSGISFAFVNGLSISWHSFS